MRGTSSVGTPEILATAPFEKPSTTKSSNTVRSRSESSARVLIPNDLEDLFSPLELLLRSIVKGRRQKFERLIFAIVQFLGKPDFSVGITRDRHLPQRAQLNLG